MDPSEIKNKCQEHIEASYLKYESENTKSMYEFYEFRNKIRFTLYGALEIYSEKNPELKSLIDWINNFDKEFVKKHAKDISKNGHLISSDDQ